MLCEHFHWLPQEIDEMPEQDYQDFLLILKHRPKLEVPNA